MIDKYLKLLNDLNEEEITIFFYYFVLKVPQKEISVQRKKTLKRVEKLCKAIKQDIDFMPIKEEIMEAFSIK